MVRALGRRLLSQSADVENVFQAAFLILARKGGRLVGSPSLAGWLYRVSYRLAGRLRATQARRRRRESTVASLPDVAEDARDVLGEITGRELMGVLDGELQRLPDEHRLPLVLCYLQGKSRDEAARELGWSPATLYRRLDEGRKRLKQSLHKRGLEWSSVLLPLAPSGPGISPLLVVRTVQAVMTHDPGLQRSGALALMAPYCGALTMKSKGLLSLVLLSMLGLGWTAYRGWRRDDSVVGRSHRSENPTVGGTWKSRRLREFFAGRQAPRLGESRRDDPLVGSGHGPGNPTVPGTYTLRRLCEFLPRRQKSGLGESGRNPLYTAHPRHRSVSVEEVEEPTCVRGRLLLRTSDPVNSRRDAPHVLAGRGRFGGGRLDRLGRLAPPARHDPFQDEAVASPRSESRLPRTSNDCSTAVAFLLGVRFAGGAFADQSAAGNGESDEEGIGTPSANLLAQSETWRCKSAKGPCCKYVRGLHTEFSENSARPALTVGGCSITFNAFLLGWCQTL
jgi:RNA polymerase sigma factor (sigma-70 family)